MTRMLPRAIALLVAVVLFTGCNGIIADPGGDGADRRDPFREPDWRDVEPSACDVATPVVPVDGVRRLTGREYDFTVEDVLGTSSSEGERFAADGRIAGFAINAGPSVGELEIAQYAEAAERIARGLEGGLAELGGCGETTGAACAELFLDRVGRRLFRQPLAPEQRGRYVALFDRAVAELGRDFEGALSTMLWAMLQSPTFLYRGEVGTEGAPSAIVPLRGLELASRLSYFLWQGPPDDALLDAALGGALDGVDGIEAEARRMLSDPRARRSVTDFHLRWLWLRTGPSERRGQAPTRTPELYPEHDDALLASMYTSFETFVADTTLSGGTFEDLMTGPEVWVDARLAPIVGVAAPSEPAWVEAPGGQRAGVLTHPLVLTVHSHSSPTIAPTWPGQLVRSQLLCDPLPPPPADIPALEDTDGLSPREIAELHASAPGCAGCHQRMDPIGFGFDQFDAIGRWRDPARLTVDARGELLFTEDADGAFVGVSELARRLAGSAQVTRCYAEKWFVAALGREPGAEDACSLSRAYSRFEESGFVVEELLLAMVTSDAFRSHRVGTEVCE